MKFFPINDEINDTVEQLFKVLRLHMDGEVSEKMGQAGYTYALNYGVSLVHLKRIAHGLPASDRLAEVLWYRQVRETMILATMVCHPKNLDAAKIEEWMALVVNNELAEQISRNLLCHVRGQYPLFFSWLQGDDVYRKVAGFLVFAYCFQQNREEALAYFPVLLTSIDEGDVSNRFISRALTRLLCQMVRYPECRPEIIQLIQNKREASWCLVVQQVEQELEWLDGE